MDNPQDERLDDAVVAIVELRERLGILLLIPSINSSQWARLVRVAVLSPGRET